jgi:hypothetical protein
MWEKIISGNIEIEPDRLRDFHILMEVSILLPIVGTLRAIIINKPFVELCFFFYRKVFLKMFNFSLLPLQQLTPHYN